MHFEEETSWGPHLCDSCGRIISKSEPRYKFGFIEICKQCERRLPSKLRK